jgi:hypothetical protein
MIWRWGLGTLLAALVPTAPAAARQAADEALHDTGDAADDYVAESLLPVNDLSTGDLDGMQDRKRIRVLVPFSKTFYFIGKGRQLRGRPAGDGA